MNGAVASFLAAFAYGPELLLASVAVPFLFLLACASPRLRKYGPFYLGVGPLLALAASAFAQNSGPFVLDQMIYPIVLVLDPPGALLLGVTAFLWTAAGIFAASSLPDETRSGAFVGYWLATLIGNIGVFMAADVVSFYLFFAFVSLPAYGFLVSRESAKDGAGGLYVAVALLGEAFLIFAFALLAAAAPDRSLLISDGVAALYDSPWRDATIGLLILGFGTKVGLLPFHLWMPATYRSAPIPAAAVLSGGAVNAGVIGLLHFFPWDRSFPIWGEALVVVGMCAAFFGVAIGLTQRNAKAILAYSSISQLGLVTATLGKGLAVGNADAATGAALYAAHHGLAKGGLFLAIGVLTGCGTYRAWRLAPFAGLLALSLAGLPISGGLIAKLAIKEPLGAGVAGTLSTVSAIATTLLMLHFLRRVVSLTEPRGAAPTWATTGSWLAVIVASIAVPTGYFFSIDNRALGTLDAGAFWEASWPVLVGAILAAAARKWLDRLPTLPEGDIASALQRFSERSAALGAAFEYGDLTLRKWPVAAAALLAIAMTISAAGLFGY